MVGLFSRLLQNDAPCLSVAALQNSHPLTAAELIKMRSEMYSGSDLLPSQVQ